MKKKNLVVILCILVLIISVTCVLTACNKEDLQSLYKPTNITYDGARISWNRVEIADHYTVSINGGEAKRVNTNMYTFAATGEEFDVTVSSVINDKSYGETKHFIPLDKIESISVSDDGMLSWENVVGATAYRISVNGEIQTQDLTEPHYTAAAGNSRIKVRAVVSGDDSYYSLWSDEKQINVYSAPTNINYDGEKLTWLGNASKYEVNINGEKQTATGGQLIYNSQNRDFSVEIKAIGDHSYSFDSVVAEETFHYLQPVMNLVVEDGVLHWDGVENAEGYEIRVNNVVQKDRLTDTQYEKLVAGAQNSVEVRPYNTTGKYFSTWSETKNIYILKTPTVRWNADLDLDGEANNNFIWDLVNGAVGYVVSIEKNDVESTHSFGSTITAFGNAYSEVGVYRVRVKAVADSTATDYCDSKYSDAITVERLAAPKLTSITSDPSNLAAGFTVNYTGVAGASGYQLYKDGALQEGKLSKVLAITDNSVADDSVTDIQNYTYMVRSMGAVKTVNGGTYVTLPCLSSGALSFNIIVQAMPKSLDMSGFSASWTAVSGANGYGVKYNGNTYVANQTNYDLSTLKAGNCDVSVCTRGNGTTTLASNYTASLRITRLVAPSNIRISYGEGEGKLEFDKVANATSYEVRYDENMDALPEDAWDNMYQFIRETGTTLNMISVANSWNDLHTVYYMTSEASLTQQFIRLAAPTFPEAPFANSTEFVWNASSNINTAEYTPTYQVYESEVMQTGGEFNGTRYSIQYLNGGMNYVFRVKAVGNDTKYLDSEMSVAVPIYKLSTPEMTIKNNEYCWSGVTNASSYVMEIDGVRVSNEQHVSGREYTYKPNYTEIGTHTVRLYAVGDSGYNNINSDVFTYEQVVKQCLAPEITFGYTAEQVVTGGAIKVNITVPSANCTKYQYEIAGESRVSDKLIESKQMESTGLYSIRVKALGGTFDSEDVYYIDSQYAGGGTGYSMTLLAPPTQASFSLNSDGAFKWATITGAFGYDYQISFDGGEFSEMAHIGQAALNPIAGFKNYKTIAIRVRATGNGSNVVTSAWVEYTWTNPNK